MPIHKLADGPVVLTVAQVETGLPSNFNPEQTQAKFVGECGTMVYLNEATALKQLARINLDYTTVIGQTLHLEQVLKNGTRYTNINKANPAMAGTAPKVAPSAAPVAAAPKQTVPELGALYAQCLDQALATLGIKCEEAGIPIDASAIQAAAATIFIKATR